jgi:hypothetical protein
MTPRPLPLPLLEKPITIHLTAVYKTAAALLRELSRAVNRGATRLRSESGLPVGTLFTLALVTDTLKAPVEVQGVVTGSVKRGRFFEMLLRYDFDPKESRRLLDSVLSLVRAEEPTRRPRREARVPLVLSVDGAALRGVTVLVENLSPRGCRLSMSGSRLPRIRAGDHLRLRLAAAHRPAGSAPALDLEVRWVREGQRGRTKRLLLGAAFGTLSRPARARLKSILELRDLRPALRLEGGRRQATRKRAGGRARAQG